MRVFRSLKIVGVAGVLACGACRDTTTQPSENGVPTPFCANSPQDPSCLVETGALFVSPSGSDVVGDGSRDKPLKTIARALATVTPDRRRIYLCEGSYPESVNLRKEHASVVLAGGLDCNWNATGVRPVIGRGGLALVIEPVDAPVTIDHIEASDSAGTESRGLVLVKGDAIFRGVHFSVARVADTIGAPVPTTAAPASVDSDVQTGTSWVCADGVMTDSAGYRGLDPDQTMAMPSNGVAPGKASTACDAGGAGADGVDGANGVDGEPQTFYGLQVVTEDGEPAAPPSSLRMELSPEGKPALRALAATDGKRGQSGSGGGNGPAGTGTGGGGGPGGCPGQALGPRPGFDPGGQAGGWSFVIAVFDAHVTIRDSILETGGGGNAAPGAPLQLGSPGQLATCIDSALVNACYPSAGKDGGCSGGRGGAGGSGGAGGGSIGGLSAFVIYRGTAPDFDPATLATSKLGPAGRGSEGGAANLRGPDGVASAAIDFTRVK